MGAGAGAGAGEGVALTGAEGASDGAEVWARPSGLACSLSTGLGWSWGLAGDRGLIGTLAGDCS